MQLKSEGMKTLCCQCMGVLEDIVLFMFEGSFHFVSCVD